MLSVRRSLYHTLEVSVGKRRGLSFVFNVVLITIITLNAIAIVLHTVPKVSQRYNQLFSIEYLLRVWVCVENEKYRHWFWGRLLGGMAAIMGIGLFALPTGILVSGFNEHIRFQKRPKVRHCPHCGKELY